MRFEEILRNRLVVSKNELMIETAGQLNAVNWPKKQHIETALEYAISQEVADIGKKHLTASAQKVFAREIAEARLLLADIQKTELSAEETKQILEKIFALIRLDS